MLISFIKVIFFNLFKEHLLSPETKHKTKASPVLNNKLLTIAPTSQFSEFAASSAVLAVLFNSITFIELSNSFKAFSALFTGSLFNKVIMIFKLIENPNFLRLIYM